jgi:hypothetical protein
LVIPFILGNGTELAGGDSTLNLGLLACLVPCTVAYPMRTSALLLALWAACGAGDMPPNQRGIAVEEVGPSETCPDGGVLLTFRDVIADFVNSTNQRTDCLEPGVAPLYQLDCTWQLDVVDGEGLAEPDGQAETSLQWQALTYTDKHATTVCDAHDNHDPDQGNYNGANGSGVGSPICVFGFEYGPEEQGKLTGTWQLHIRAGQAWADFADSQGTRIESTATGDCWVKRWDESHWVDAELSEIERIDIWE